MAVLSTAHSVEKESDVADHVLVRLFGEQNITGISDTKTRSDTNIQGPPKLRAGRESIGRKRHDLFGSWL